MFMLIAAAGLFCLTQNPNASGWNLEHPVVMNGQAYYLTYSSANRFRPMGKRNDNVMRAVEPEIEDY